LLGDFSHHGESILREAGSQGRITLNINKILEIELSKISVTPMCCFSQSVQRVANTRIFSRRMDESRQAIAYQMEFAAAADLAMILPLPIVPGSGEKVVKFINLKEYSTFFSDLDSAFPRPEEEGFGRGVAVAGGSPKPQLAVQSVGSFEASFVPTVADFRRLDERFRIEPEIWAKIPRYADYGFAVFKLKKGAHKVHPMALSFPSRHPEKLFFPTVHIHDGEVHAKEHFDHELYCQVSRPGLFEMMRWEESPGIAKAACKIEKSAGLIFGEGHIYRRRMIGNFANKDVVLGAA
jgi:hypothetical protein